MADEIRALEGNKTWVLADLPPEKKPISCKWVYKVKCRSYDSIERYKARLVIRGGHQIEGFDYNEIFAVAAKMGSVRSFLSVVAARNWELPQLDVNNAFLHGDLEEVYITPPVGFSTGSQNKVCKLQKSLYRLKHAPRQWFAKLSSTLTAYGFVRSYADYSLFTYRKGDVFLALLVYIDDIILAGNISQACQDFKAYLHNCFRIKDLGPLKYFLGIEVARGTQGLFLSQRKYTLEIADECDLLGSKPVDFPVEENHKLALATGYYLNDPRRLIGRLIYLPSPILSSPMQFMFYPNLSIMHVLSILMQFDMSYAISRGLQDWAFFFDQIALFRLQLFVVQTGEHVPSLGGL